jgi:hypothetical protein
VNNYSPKLLESQLQIAERIRVVGQDAIPRGNCQLPRGPIDKSARAPLSIRTPRIQPSRDTRRGARFSVPASAFSRRNRRRYVVPND